ncbi:MAG TPA: cysteine desulfurase [Acholeplasmataceae bacterium]|nr:cysteine desulfurase [Acholeplasmataceae bacterium]
MIYLDYGATTPIDEEVLQKYIEVSKTFFANPNSLHKLGQESNYMFDVAVNEIKNILRLKNHEIVFTANATEANNLAIFGIVEKHKSGKIITTKIEHPSVYNVMKSLEDRFNVIYLDIDENGLVDLNQLEKELTKDTILVSIMWVNNIIGTIQKIGKVIDLVKKYPKAKLHVDAVQGLCKIEPNFDLNDVDIFTFSSHKFYGPKGIGGLIFKKEIEFAKRLYGASNQFNIKPGTISLPLIVATAKAFQKFYPSAKEHYEYVKMLNLYLREQLEKNENLVINTPKENVSYYVLNLSFPNINGETIVHTLEQDNIYVSTGSACSSKLKRPERTVFELTKDENRASKSIRVTLSHLTTKEEIDALLLSINRIR